MNNSGLKSRKTQRKSNNTTTGSPDNNGDTAGDAEDSWTCRHFAWCLPSNMSCERHSYSTKLHLKEKDETENKEDIKEDVTQFKPWSHYKNKRKFEEMYENLRLGNRRWYKSSHNSLFYDYFQVFVQYIIFILLLPLLLIEIIIVYGAILFSVFSPFITSIFYSIFAGSEVVEFDKKHGVIITGKASEIQSIRFSVYRLFHYGYWVTTFLFLALSRLISGRQNISLIHDNELIVYMHSNQHLKLEYNKNGKIIGGFIDNSDVIQFEKYLYKGRYFPILKIHYNYKTNIISFTLNDDNKTVITNDRNSCSSSVWDLLKANYISQRCIMDTLTHSWVHFHFSDIVSSEIYNYFGNTPKSVLGRIIHSHFIYTSSVNTAGAGDHFNQPQISGDADNCINTLNPVKANPMKIKGAHGILKMRIIKHYYDEQGLTEYASPKAVKAVSPKEHKTLNQHKFPPPEIKQRLELFKKEYNPSIRGYSLYWDMLADYYLAVYLFINALVKNKLLNENELNGFIQVIDKNGMHGLSECNNIHVLCTLIWTNGYIHPSDHTTFYNIMRNFPHLGVYYKLDINDPHDDSLENHWKKYYRSWFASWISFKSEIFIHTFTQPIKSCFGKIADYSASPLLYRKFENIASLKKENGAGLKKVNEIHEEYLKEINNISDKYEWMINVNELDASISY